ncbi:MAG: hypothetical protein MUO24_03210 [Desulfobacterales bacterium]|nr:hypothetical protein [Desulfobacterales bacterium]
MPRRIISHFKRTHFFWPVLGTVFFFFVLAYTTPVLAKAIAGSYLLIGDSDGTVPKKKAVITLTFKGGNEGTLAVKATQPGETLEDTGTYAIAGNSITMRFKELEWQAENQPFTFDGCTLVLPFKALSGTPGPGTSTWVKKDAACKKLEATAQQHEQPAPQENTSATSKSEQPASTSESEQPTSNNEDTADNPPEQPPTESGKKTCEECKYVPCIKSIIKQKKAIVAALNTIAEQHKWGSLDEPTSNDFFDLNSLDTPEKRWQAIKMLNEDHDKLWNKVGQLLDPALAKELKENCKIAGTGVLSMDTNPLTCIIDPESKEAVEAAMPCEALAKISYIHETYHVTKCEERHDKHLGAIFKQRGETREEVEAYTQSIALLSDLLQKAEDKCLWLCRCNQQRYESAAACSQNCPHAQLGVCHAPTCLELDPKTQEWIPGKGRAF